MRVALTVAIVTLLCGCETMPTSGLQGPADRCMQRPGPLANEKAGDDLLKRHARLRHDNIELASRVRCLQRYVVAVTR